ncbi:MAG: sugar ABC transporter permease [Lachnospiraceae bacterium]|nr:sugar ABC transporter permease [Lachnospiraceae bacterium]
MKSHTRAKSELPYILMGTPAVVLFAIFFVVPLLYTVRYSFYNWTNFSPDITWAGLTNYKKIFSDSTVLRGIKNSLVYAFFTVTFQSLIALPVASVLNTKFRGRNFYRAAFFCPAVLSTLVVGYLWKYILSAGNSGLINSILTSFGLETINFLGNGKLALASIIFTQVWQWFGWSMVIYLGNLQSINADLYESASIDGASTFRKFWHVTIPGLAPAIKINLVSGMISGLKVFDVVLSMTGGGPAHKTDTILLLMYSKFSDGNYGYAAAFGIMFLLVSMALSAVLLGLFGKWERRLGQ